VKARGWGEPPLAHFADYPVKLDAKAPYGKGGVRDLLGGAPDDGTDNGRYEM
jgi:hypothetical protein